MRSEEEQIAGLKLVQDLVPEALILVPHGVRDVVSLQHRGYEIVYVVNGYDLWKAGGGGMVKANLSVEEAAKELQTRGLRSFPKPR